jgi:hypothetical protein
VAERTFNTAGPVVPAEHYCIDPLSRVDWPEFRHLIDGKKYFVLHAPRQTGKTTTLLQVMAALNAEGRYACVYANIEAAQAARGDETQGIPTVAGDIAASIDLYTPGLGMEDWLYGTGNRVPPQRQVSGLLAHWAEVAGRAVVLLLDEVDALVGDTLISLLRQIRSGYASRPVAFPQSVVLCGVRDVRDYRMTSPGGEVITGGSAFNIKTESLRMGDFSEAEVRSLWGQHTAETGQRFDEAIWPELWLDTAGQPWLVNALGYEATWKDRSKRDRAVPVTLADYRDARERLIQSRATHLDQLADKLKEPRVHSVVANILSGETDASELAQADLDYVVDLGLITLKPSRRIANRIYQEVIPRELTYGTQYGIPNQETAWYVRPDHSLDVGKLLAAFQQFFRENSEAWEKGFSYAEAGPQLLLQAFLQRIVNGGGRISREYALGRKRTDLFLEWPLDADQAMHGPLQRVVIELKLWRGGDLEKLLAESLAQTADYADRVGADEAHLIVFDRTGRHSWEERLWRRSETYGARPIQVWGA